ncbi:hypothetical protein [Enterococcus dongliensis]|uniref:hypothetical protein n=1 Tax=Enterococcus dongliensis TaxID=2559925 RepID=UPI00288D113B|nr:hypothetical protein [Enterococcus dongliensis]MDT2612789.1 hypothetical protein [Enterococcus dongliensis]
MKGMLDKIKIIFKKGNLIDIIDYLRYVVTIILCFVMMCVYNLKYLLSIRGAISNTISFSSIILGILGLLIGLLMSLKEDSLFFKQAKKYDNMDDDVYAKLMIRLRNAFMYNLALLILSVIYCFIIPNMNFYIKSIGLMLWFFLFLIVAWDTIYLIWIIVKICTYKPEEKSIRESRS